MAQTREIRTQIASIKNTQKITRAMELVAASKMRKAQERMARSRPYAEKIRNVIAHLAKSHTEYQHPYLQQRAEIKRVGYIVVTSDRGLCGGLNITLLRKLILELRDYEGQQVEIDLCVIGRKGLAFFRQYGGKIVGATEKLGDQPSVNDLIGVVKVMLDKFDQGSLDAVYLASNEFVNTMTQRPYVRHLLPLEPKAQEEEAIQKGHWDYIYEPDSAKELLDMLLRRYIESQVYQAVIENVACFMAAQMVAMKNATENAGELISELQLVYNKARQANITQEIAEIVGGAAAIE